MNHLTMEQLLELREPGREPGAGAAYRHFEGCEQCRTEADRLAQRVARLKALPSPRASRNRFLEIRSRFTAERRRRRLRSATVAGLALAASVALVIVLRNAGGAVDPTIASAAADAELRETMSRSRDLEAALRAFDPDRRVIDGRTASIAFRLEDQLGAVDRQLEMLGLMPSSPEPVDRERLRLWRERVGLLDALMDVHLTRAKYAGM